jgi:hypothetical protein
MRQVGKRKTKGKGKKKPVKKKTVKGDGHHNCSFRNNTDASRTLTINNRVTTSQPSKRISGSRPSPNSRAPEALTPAMMMALMAGRQQNAAPSNYGPSQPGNVNVVVHPANVNVHPANVNVHPANVNVHPTAGHAAPVAVDGRMPRNAPVQENNAAPVAGRALDRQPVYINHLLLHQSSDHLHLLQSSDHLHLLQSKRMGEAIHHDLRPSNGQSLLLLLPRTDLLTLLMNSRIG